MPRLLSACRIPLALTADEAALVAGAGHLDAARAVLWQVARQRHSEQCVLRAACCVVRGTWCVVRGAW